MQWPTRQNQWRVWSQWANRSCCWRYVHWGLKPPTLMAICGLRRELPVKLASSNAWGCKLALRMAVQGTDMAVQGAGQIARPIGGLQAKSPIPLAFCLALGSIASTFLKFSFIFFHYKSWRRSESEELPSFACSLLFFFPTTLHSSYCVAVFDFW